MPKEKRCKKKIHELTERLDCITESMEDHMYGCNLRQRTTLRITTPPIVAVVFYGKTFRVRICRVKVKARLGCSPLKSLLARTEQYADFSIHLISVYILRRRCTCLPLRSVNLSASTVSDYSSKESTHQPSPTNRTLERQEYNSPRHPDPTAYYPALAPVLEPGLQ